MVMLPLVDSGSYGSYLDTLLPVITPPNNAALLAQHICDHGLHQDHVPDALHTLPCCMQLFSEVEDEALAQYANVNHAPWQYTFMHLTMC